MITVSLPTVAFLLACIAIVVDAPPRPASRAAARFWFGFMALVFYGLSLV